MLFMIKKYNFTNMPENPIVNETEIPGSCNFINSLFIGRQDKIIDSIGLSLKNYEKGR